MEVNPSTPALSATLLVVDDEEDILLSVADVVEAMVPGARVLTAGSGAAALDVLRRERVDVVVSDYKMPMMDGIAFLRQSRTLAPQVPRVLMTAFPDPSLEGRAREEAGVLRLVPKPIDVGAFVLLVGGLLAERVNASSGA